MVVVRVWLAKVKEVESVGARQPPLQPRKMFKLSASSGHTNNQRRSRTVDKNA